MPLVTSMFIHVGWVHFLGNMLYLWVFGDNVEDRMGRLRFLLFYLLCGAIAAGAQMIVNPFSRVPMIGASGAIAGVLGAYLRMFPGTRVLALVPFFFFLQLAEVPAVIFFGLLVYRPARPRHARARRHAGGRAGLLGAHRRLCSRLRAGPALSQKAQDRGAAPVVIPGEQGKQDAHPNSLVASLHGVGKVYHPGSPGEVIALAGIDLEVAPGESIALVGPSGCGKSTLLHILGLLDRPTTGTVTVAGIDVLQVNRHALPRFATGPSASSFSTTTSFPP